MRTALGIDVAASRPHAYAVVDDDGVVVRCGAMEHGAIRGRVRDLIKEYAVDSIGIDAPRALLSTRRTLQWKRGSWRNWRGGLGHGRHCEVVISNEGLAQPQWTPIDGHEVPPWILLGIDVFKILRSSKVPLHEVFPAASTALFDRLDVVVPLTFAAAAFAKVRRDGVSTADVLDAAVAAITAREVAADRGCEVGGGDGLGTIALPRPLSSVHPALHQWPRR